MQPSVRCFPRKGSPHVSVAAAGAMESIGAAGSHLDSGSGCNSSSIAPSAAAAAANAAAEGGQAVMAPWSGVACLEAAADVNHDSSLAEREQQAALAMPAAGAPRTQFQEGRRSEPSDAAASMHSAKRNQQAGQASAEAIAAHVQRQAGRGSELVKEADKHPRGEYHAGQLGQAAAAQAGGGVEHLRAAEKQLNKISWWLELTKGSAAAGKGSKADQQVRFQQHCCFPF